MYTILNPLQLAAYLRALRKSRGMTQGEVGASLGVTPARISQIERDPSKLGFSQLQQLIHVLGARLLIETQTADPRVDRTFRNQVAHGEW